MKAVTDTTAVLIGHGLIGKALRAKIERAEGWSIEAIIRKDTLCGPTGSGIGRFQMHMLKGLTARKLTVIFLAVPSTAKGGAVHYLKEAISLGVPIVSCEKWALSHTFDEFVTHLDKIGFSAMVGGGTRPLSSLRERLNGRKDVVAHAVLNATLNFILHAMDHDGDSLGIAVDKAKALGLAEPEGTDDLGVLNGEMGDTAMKTAVAYNICMRSEESLDASKVSINLLSERDLARLVREVSIRRYIVSFFPPGFDDDNNDVIGGFSHEIEGWKIRAGFQRTDTNPLFRGRLPAGANNCVITCEGARGENGIYVLSSGPGAGPKPTAASMMSDARRLLRL